MPLERDSARLSQSPTLKRPLTTFFGGCSSCHWGCPAILEGHRHQCEACGGAAAAGEGAAGLRGRSSGAPAGASL